MKNIEKQTLENLIDFLHCNESLENFKRKRYFLFNFAILWNLFEDRCMNNFAQIRNVDNFVNELHIPDSFEIDFIYNYFRDRYFGTFDSPIYFSGLLWRTQEESYKNMTKNILQSNNSNTKDKIKACLYIIFRLRNNLFHGEKDISIINEQKKTFVYVNKFLMNIIKIKNNR